MDVSIESKEWETMSHEEKNHQLFLNQKETLALFLERGAISQAQHEPQHDKGLQSPLSGKIKSQYYAILSCLIFCSTI